MATHPAGTWTVKMATTSVRVGSGPDAASRRRSRIDPLKALYLIAALYVIAFLLFPLGKVLFETAGYLFNAERPLPSSLIPYMMRITWNSIQLALITTVVCVVIATPLAIAIAKLRLPFRTGWTVLLTLPFITPPFISSFAVIILFGRSGVLTRILESIGITVPSIYGLNGLVLTQVLHLTPYALLLILAGLRTVPKHTEEAALSMGEGFFGTMRRIVVPYIYPHILAGAVLVFLSSIGDVGAPLLIGGNYRVLPVEIYSNFVSFLGDDRIPVIFSAWIILITAFMLYFVKRLLDKTEVKHKARAETFTYDIRWLRRLATVVLTAVTAFFMLPYAAILVSSFGTVWSQNLLPNAFTLANYQRALSDTQPIMNSMFLVAVITPICLFLAVMLGHMQRSMPRLRWFDYFTLLPFVIPGVVIGVGVIRAYSGVTLFGIDFTASAIVLIVAVSIRRLAHTMRVLTAGYARIDQSQEEASWSLGASNILTFWRVVLPQMSATLFAAAVIAITKVITELGATLLVYPPGWRTMPVYIFFYVSEGQIARGSAMGVILILMVGVGTAVANMISRSRRAAT
jgi:iron(III) transport system permease protein